MFVPSVPGESPWWLLWALNVALSCRPVVGCLGFTVDKWERVCGAGTGGPVTPSTGHQADEGGCRGGSGSGGDI